MKFILRSTFDSWHNPIAAAFVAICLVGSSTDAGGAPPTSRGMPDAGRIVSVPGLRTYDLGGLTLSFLMGTKAVFIHVKRAGLPGDGTWLAIPLLYLSAPSAQRITDGKILVIGEAHGGVKTVVVLDRDASKILDSFWCMIPSVSPDLRYLAYTMAPEPHAGKEQSEFAAVYDFRAGRNANRSAWPEGAEDIDVGTEVYPDAGKFNPARDAWPGPTHSLGPNYVWSRDSKQFTFFDSINGDAHSSGPPVKRKIVVLRVASRWTVRSEPAAPGQE